MAIPSVRRKDPVSSRDKGAVNCEENAGFENGREDRRKSWSGIKGGRGGFEEMVEGLVSPHGFAER